VGKLSHDATAGPNPVSKDTQLFMKTLLSLVIIVVALCCSCKKSASGDAGTAGLINSWRLAQVNAAVGNNSFVETPAPDSSVLLTFNADNTYASYLDGQLVSHGGFSLTTDSQEVGWQLVELNNFQTTGLLSDWKLYLDTAGTLVLIDDKMALNISHDTLYMEPGSLSFGGWNIYIFLKQ
jgi:hypothetical protein